ncbi:hypothetical protein Bbelb_117940 [Branchiostoma belcheri]|nr:hypothetical protein Bbelb_117940 [Branchiostoma belcheri]
MSVHCDGPASSTDDWRRDVSATFWKSAEVHHRAKRNSEAKTVLILGKRSGPPASDGPPQVTTPAAPTAPPQVTTPAAPIAPPAGNHTVSGEPKTVAQQSPCMTSGDKSREEVSTLRESEIRIGSGNVRTMCETGKTVRAQIDQTPRHDTLILMGDFKANVGTDNKDYKACMGREGVARESSPFHDFGGRHA